MKKSVYKYELALEDEVTILMPEGAVVLRADIDPRGSLCVWALVDVLAKAESVTFYLRGTGHTIDDELGETVRDAANQYVSTIIASPFVWHLFIGRTSADAS